MTAAPERAPAHKPRPEQEFFCFELGGLQLGIPSENVREVLRAGPMTPLPRTPSYILGVTGHRGEVLPVLDLLRFLGKGEARLTARTRLFVGLTGSFVTAVLADAVEGLTRIPVSDILAPPVGGDLSTEHLLGVVQTQGGEILSLMNFAKVLQTARQRAVSR